MGKNPFVMIVANDKEEIQKLQICLKEHIQFETGNIIYSQAHRNFYTYLGNWKWRDWREDDKQQP